jgi:type III restriction enzyme
VTVKVEKTQKGDEIKVISTYQTVSNIGNIGQLPYNQFVKAISHQTNLPISLLHKVLSMRLSQFSEDEIKQVINEKTLAKIVQSWQAVFLEKFATKYHYDALNFKAKTSILRDDEFVAEIASGDIGTIEVATQVDKRNLFDKILVDSEIPEGEIAKVIPDDEIKVFGKIPRRSIQVPTYTGGTSTPDFVFATKNDLFLLVEAKSGQLRESEIHAVTAQEQLFDKFRDVKWSKVTTKDEVLELLNVFKNED